MSHQLANALLEAHLKKVQQLQPYSQCSAEELHQHKHVLNILFSPNFQRQIALVPDGRKNEFCKSLELCLPNLEQLQVEPALSCLCASLQFGKQSPQLREAADRWVSKVIRLMDADSVEPAIVLEVITSVPFIQFHIAMSDNMKQDCISAVARNVNKFTGGMQKDLVSALIPVQDEIHHVIDLATQDMSRWMENAPRPPETAKKLIETLNKFYHSNLLKLFTTIKDANLKERFLMSIALMLKSIEDPSRFLWMCNVEQDLPRLSDALQKKFFLVLDEYGNAKNVMDMWLTERTAKYNGDLIGISSDVLSTRKDELKSILMRVFGENADNDGWVTLDRIPCPVNGAILKFFASKCENFFVPTYAITRETIGKIIGKLDGFEMDLANNKCRHVQGAVQGLLMVPDGISSPSAQPIVTPNGMEGTGEPDNLIDFLLAESFERVPLETFNEGTRVSRGVYRFGTKEVTFTVKHGALFVYSINAARVGEMPVDQFLMNEFGRARQSGLQAAPDIAAHLQAQKSQLSQPLRPLTTALPGGQTLQPFGIGGSISTKKSEAASVALDISQQLVKRSIDWNDGKFLGKIIKKGFHDQHWVQLWRTFLSKNAISPDSKPKKLSTPMLATFLESHLSEVMAKDWARDLLYNDHSKEELSSAESEPRYPDRSPSSSSRDPNRIIGGFGEMDSGHNPMNPFYKTRMCYPFLEGRCLKGDECNYAHTDEEIRGQKKPPMSCGDGLLGDKAGTKAEGSLSAAPMSFAQFQASYNDNIKKEPKEKKEKKKKRRDMSDDGSGMSAMVYTNPEDDPFYKTAMCRFAQKGTCWFGDTCYYGHNERELRVPPDGIQPPADQLNSNGGFRTNISPNLSPNLMPQELLTLNGLGLGKGQPLIPLPAGPGVVSSAMPIGTGFSEFLRAREKDRQEDELRREKKEKKKDKKEKKRRRSASPSDALRPVKEEIGQERPRKDKKNRYEAKIHIDEDDL